MGKPTASRMAVATFVQISPGMTRHFRAARAPRETARGVRRAQLWQVPDAVSIVLPLIDMKRAEYPVELSTSRSAPNRVF